MIATIPRLNANDGLTFCQAIVLRISEVIATIISLKHMKG